MKKASWKRKKHKTLEQKTISVSKTSFFADLPEDIIADILVRLPVATLVSSKSVCRLWLYLISNPKFIKTHLESSHLLNSYKNHRLIFTHDHSDHNNQGDLFASSYFIKSIPINIDDESNVVVLDYPTRDPLNRVSIVGSCNGLVCIAIDKVGVFLWNPCTRISRELPLSGLEIDKLSNYGFGYDQFSDDYKVVLMMNAVGSNDFEHKKEVKVYSLKSDSWAKMEDLQHRGNTFECKAEHVNGVLHWVVVYLGFTDLLPVIVSLDLGNETYGEIEQPCYGEGCNSYIELGVLEGCLSVFCHFKDPNGKFCADIWVMKEYGISDTWIKLYTIPYTTEHKHVFAAFYLPLCISVTGEILSDIRHRLVLYNPNNGRFRKPRFGSLFRTFTRIQTTTYVESLVSPNNI